MSYEIVGVVGDVNPLQYGGWLIGKNPKQVDCLVIEPIDWEENGLKQGEGVDCLVYTVALDRIGAHEYESEWWNRQDFRDSFARNTNLPWCEFLKSIGSADPVQRAWAWQEIAMYYGIANLDDQPRRESEASLRGRFALPFWRARKRGVTVYA